MDLMLLLLPLVAILAFLVGYLGQKITTVRTIGDADRKLLLERMSAAAPAPSA